MSTATLYRMTGMALLAGALLSIVGSILSNFLFPGSTNPTAATNVLFVAVNLVSLVGTILFVLGAPGIAAAQRAQAGRLGILGIALVISAGILFAGTSILSIVVTPWLDVVAPNLLANIPAGLFVLYLVASLSLGIGGLMLGIATIRARVFIKWAAWLIIIGTVLNLAAFTPIPIPDAVTAIVSTVAALLFFAGLGWMGYALYTGEWQAAAAAHANA